MPSRHVLRLVLHHVHQRLNMLQRGHDQRRIGVDLLLIGEVAREKPQGLDSRALNLGVAIGQPRPKQQTAEPVTPLLPSRIRRSTGVVIALMPPPLPLPPSTSRFRARTRCTSPLTHSRPCVPMSPPVQKPQKSSHCNHACDCPLQPAPVEPQRGPHQRRHALGAATVHRVKCRGLLSVRGDGSAAAGGREPPPRKCVQQIAVPLGHSGYASRLITTKKTLT